MALCFDGTVHVWHPVSFERAHVGTCSHVMSHFFMQRRASSPAASRVRSDGTQCWPSRCGCSCNAHTYLPMQTFQALDFALSSCTQQRSGPAATKSLVCLVSPKVRPVMLSSIHSTFSGFQRRQYLSFFFAWSILVASCELGRRGRMSVVLQTLIIVQCVVDSNHFRLSSGTPLLIMALFSAPLISAARHSRGMVNTRIFILGQPSLWSTMRHVSHHAPTHCHVLREFFQQILRQFTKTYRQHVVDTHSNAHVQFCVH